MTDSEWADTVELMAKLWPGPAGKMNPTQWAEWRKALAEFSAGWVKDAVTQHFRETTARYSFPTPGEIRTALRERARAERQHQAAPAEDADEDAGEDPRFAEDEALAASATDAEVEGAVRMVLAAYPELRPLAFDRNGRRVDWRRHRGLRAYLAERLRTPGPSDRHVWRDRWDRHNRKSSGWYVVTDDDLRAADDALRGPTRLRPLLEAAAGRSTTPGPMTVDDVREAVTA